MQCWRGSCGNALQAELLLQTFFWGNNYFWWCCLFAQCGWRLTSFQCSSRALFFESPLWWCGPCRKIFVPGNFKWTKYFQMDSGGAQKSGPCFFTRNLVCCHLQCCQRQGDMSHPCILATLKENAICIHSKCLWKVSFGGMPNSRNVLFLQIFLNRAAKPSAGNTSAEFPWIKKATNPVELDLPLHQSLPDLLRNLLRNPVEPDLAPNLALHQSLPEPSPEPCWTWPGSAPKPPGTFSGTFSRTFSGTLLSLTCLCTKASRNLLRNLHRNPVEPNLALHQSLPEPSPEPSPEPCWTWPGSPTKPPRPSPEPSPEPCWTWPDSAPKPPGTFSGTFPETCWT